MDKNNQYKTAPDPYNFKETGEFIAEYLQKPKAKEEEIRNQAKKKKQ